MKKIERFPDEYDRKVDKRIEEETAAASKRSLERIQQLQNQKIEVKKGQINGAEIGLIFGLIGCIFVCTLNWGLKGDFSVALGYGALTYLIILLVCWFIGTYINNAIYKGITIQNGEIDKQIDIEKEEAKNELQDIRSEGERKKKSYRQAFDEEVQSVSENFSNSPLVNNVADWMTNAFFNQIKAGDRRPHIKKVSVSFEFDVFCVLISCDLGFYDFDKGLKGAGFELKRCSNLNGPIEQMALARAIARAIQLNTVMHFPKDPCGSDILIEIDYKYMKDSVHTTVCYTAENFAYEERASWYGQEE